MTILSDTTRLSPEVRAAVAVFLQNYQPGTRQFAMSEALAAVRRVFPVMSVSDNDLTDAIAGEAVAAGLNVHIDGSSGAPVAFSAVERWEDEGGAVQKLNATAR